MSRMKDYLITQQELEPIGLKPDPAWPTDLLKKIERLEIRARNVERTAQELAQELDEQLYGDPHRRTA